MCFKLMNTLRNYEHFVLDIYTLYTPNILCVVLNKNLEIFLKGGWYSEQKVSYK